MTYEELFEELKIIALQLSIPVRFETGDFEGGVCVVNDERVIIMNKKATLPKKISTMSAALEQCGLDGIFIKPAVREAIEDEMAKLRVMQPQGDVKPVESAEN
jgi:hypothetical protein